MELWQARQARGWTRVQASQIIKLRVGQLEAIESNDIAALPPPFYMRAHLREYARLLGLDPGDIVERYTAQFGDVAQQAPVRAPRRPLPTARLTPIAPLARAAMLLVLVLVGLLLLNSPASIVETEVTTDYANLVERKLSIETAGRLVH